MVIKMSQNCINANTGLIYNPDNDNYCRCSCKANWLMISIKGLQYGKLQEYHTNIYCDICKHYVYLLNSFNTSIIGTVKNCNSESYDVLKVSKVNDIPNDYYSDNGHFYVLTPKKAEMYINESDV